MEHVGYHGTAAAFSHFSEEMFGSASDRSPNGALGVWVFTDRSYADHYAKGAGGRTLRVASSGAKAIRIAANQMRRDHTAAGMTDDPLAGFGGCAPSSCSTASAASTWSKETDPSACRCSSIPRRSSQSTS